MKCPRCQGSGGLYASIGGEEEDILCSACFGTGEKRLKQPEENHMILVKKETRENFPISLETNSGKQYFTIEAAKELTQKLLLVLGEDAPEIEKSKYRTRLPDANTPMDTIVRVWDHNTDGTTYLRHFIGFDDEDKQIKVLQYALASGVQVESYELWENAVIDTIADLTWRGFLNAPEEYKYFRIDADGKGNVFIEKPELYDDEWFTANLEHLPVGDFSMYADEYAIIEIDR